MAKPNAKAPLGQGGRFAALKAKLGKRKGITNPGALAASIGRKKYGTKKFAALSHLKGSSVTDVHGWKQGMPPGHRKACG
jgi:hypothetical protein